MITYECFQPEYMKKFKCDGQACNAHCCRYGWQIDIDKKTYKQYSHLKPKSAAREIMRHIKKNEGDKYTVRLDEKGVCPFLTENNLCKIQREHGEEFLSETCATYPRFIWNLEEAYECSLNLSCPVAAKLILLETEPLKFEKIEAPENFTRLLTLPKTVSPHAKGYFMLMQEIAISVLQARSLPIDRRILMLGLYCDKLDELLETGWEDDLEKIQAVYQNPAFLQEQAEQFSPVIKFNAQNHIKILSEVLGNLYSDDQSADDRKFLDTLTNVLQMKVDENNKIQLNETAEKYIELGAERQKFLQRFSTIFENYLVNEWFLNFYPFRFYGATLWNYSIFVTTYKLIELLTFVSSMEKNENYTAEDLVSEIILFAKRTDHNLDYIKKIAEYFNVKKDVVEVMKDMLQV